MILVAQSLLIAFSMYSRIPVPAIPWKEGNRRYVICFFPLVGAVIGAAEAALLITASRLALPDAAIALLLIALPVGLTGGIHLDGLVDTADARNAFRGKEERLRILKDPHIGAFGVIRLALYLLLLCAALLTALAFDGAEREKLAELAWLCMIFSRCLSGWSVAAFPCAKEEGTLYLFSGQGARRRVRGIVAAETAICAAALFAVDYRFALPVIAGNLLLFFCYYRMSVRKFGGVTGDLAGWFLCLSELVSAAGIALAAFLLREAGIG